MIGGILNTGLIGEFGFGDFENEMIAGCQVGLQFGYKTPSVMCLQFINTFIKELKAISSVGSLSSYSDISIYLSDVTEFPFGFDGIKWNNAEAELAVANNGVVKVKGRGCYSNGSNGFIDRRYNPSNETITTIDDVFHFVAWQDVNNTATDHSSGATFFSFKHGNTNHGWNLYRGGNLGGARTGYLPFYAESNSTTSFFYWLNTLQTSATTLLTASKVNMNLYSLALNNGTGAINFTSPRTIESLAIVGKRSEINRTSLYNAVNTFINNMATLRD